MSAASIMTPPEHFLHAYERLSLSTAGIVMGIILILLYGTALCYQEGTRNFLKKAHDAPLLGQVTLGVAVAWFMLLMLNTPWNTMRLDLFSFESLRTPLLLAAPAIWFVLSSMVKENLFPRALGFLILLAVCVPLTAAFLKEPATRLLIPIWCYPVLTLAMFWVAKPYLFRDMMSWFTARPKLMRAHALVGVLYGAAMLFCALMYW